MIWVDVDKAVDAFLDALVKAQVKTQVALFYAEVAKKNLAECRQYHAEKLRRQAHLFKRDKEEL